MADQRIDGFPGSSGVGRFPGLPPKKTLAEEKTEGVAKGALPHPDSEPTAPTSLLEHTVPNPDPGSPVGAQAGRTGHVANKVLNPRIPSSEYFEIEEGGGPPPSKTPIRDQGRTVRRKMVEQVAEVEEQEAGVKEQEAGVKEQEAGVKKEEAGVEKEAAIKKRESFEEEIKKFSSSDRRLLEQIIRAIDESVSDASFSDQEMMERIAEVLHENEGRLSPEARAFLYREIGRLGINVSELRLLIEKKQQGGERKENEAVLSRTQRGPALAQAPKTTPQRSDSKEDRSTKGSQGGKKRRKEGTFRGGINEVLSRIKGNILRRKRQRERDVKADKKEEERKADEKKEEDEKESAQQTET